MRIAGEHEYIELGGEPTTAIAMDSGVFGMGAIGELAPATYLDGTFYEYGSALGYNSAFALDAIKGPGKWNPEVTSLGQFSGLLTSGKTFVGNILDQEAFKRPLIPDPVHEGEFITDEQSGLLYEKKLTATLCPASIFTGRTRLYVQALYGLPLSRKPNQKSTYVTGLPYALNITGLSTSPSLKLRSSPVSGDEVRGPDVTLTTSCGVWLDPETGRHWLFQISNGCNVYPLKLRSGLASLRKHLTVDSKLNALDKHHLETYLLSQSLPDANARQVVTGGVSDMYSMGYGWHWNYSGNEAAVVEHTYSQWSGNSSLYYTMSSLLGFSVKKVVLPEPAGGFAPGSPTIAWEGIATRGVQAKWAGYRSIWTFAEPDFETGESVKSFPRYNPPVLACSDIPIYVYYIGDVMKLCSATIRYVESTTATDESVGFNGNAERTYGMQGGFTETKTTPAHFDMTLTCGDYTSYNCTGGHTTTGSEVVLSDKFNLTWYQYATSNYYGIVGPPFDYTYYDGTTWRYGRVAERDGLMDQNRQQGSSAEENSASLVMVVPANDSQAIFIHSSTNKAASRSGTTELIQYNHTAFTFVRDAIWYGDSGTVDLPDWYGWDQINGKLLTRTATGPYSETSSSGETKSHFVGAQTLPCTFNNLGQFASNDLESVSSGAFAWSSAYQQTPIIMASGMGVAPSNATDVYLPVITGWV